LTENAATEFACNAVWSGLTGLLMFDVTSSAKRVSFDGRSMVVIGFGSIGPAVLPLILRHIDVAPDRITVIAADARRRELAEREGVIFQLLTLTSENFAAVLGERLDERDMLINLSVGVSSFDLIEFCNKRGILYLDTSNENWPCAQGAEVVTTFGRRSRALSRWECFRYGPTALVYHGANPGLVSHFTKKAILDVAAAIGRSGEQPPQSPNEWALLAQRSGIVALHISERDTQLGSIGRRPGEFVNTWSVDGFIEEAGEPAGFAWGLHEDDIPSHLIEMKLQAARCRVIELARPGGSLQIRSWIPSCGTFHGFLIPHPEAFSIAELLTLRSDDGTILYQPTVHFAYQPCSDALASMHDAAALDWIAPANKRLLSADVVEGMDELGILVLRRHEPSIYWYGSRLEINEARRLAPNNNATTLQVAAGVLAGLVWLIENPRSGLIEPEQVDFARALQIAAPYLGILQGYSSSWIPNGDLTSALPRWQFTDLVVNLL
jgi:homospermidine synthase